MTEPTTKKSTGAGHDAMKTGPGAEVSERRPGDRVHDGDRTHETTRFREDAAGRVRRMDTELLGILFEEAARVLRLRGVEVERVLAEAADTPGRRQADARRRRKPGKMEKTKKAEKTEKGLVADFREKVLGHAARTGLSDSRFGVLATGDPSLVRRLRRGESPRLGTVDRVLSFLGEAPVGPAFRLEAEAFVAVTRTKESVFSRESSGNQSFLTQLRRGAKPRLDTADRVRAWMRANCTGGEWNEIRARVAAGMPEPPAGEAPWVSASWRADDGLFDGRERLDARDAAALAGISPGTLEYYRSRGLGPAFERVGRRVRYLRKDVEAWVLQREGGGSGGGRDGEA